jgi:hypothetical protein
MFWIVLLTIGLLAGFACDWVVVHSTAERITVSLELVKIVPAIRKAKATAISLVRREHKFGDRRH